MVMKSAVLNSHLCVINSRGEVDTQLASTGVLYITHLQLGLEAEEIKWVYVIL